MDRNNYVVVQYNQVAMNQPNNQDNEPYGCTVGIQGRGGQVGLSYAFITTYAPGAATVQNGRAILFTTDARVLFGQVDGHVYDAGTGQPLPGVLVTTDRYGYGDTTDAQGHYHLTNVMIGTYVIIASKYRFNSDTISNIMIALDSTTTLNYQLHHPEVALSVDSVVETARDSTVQTTFNLLNNGNGPLDYVTRILPAGDNNPAPWDSVGNVSISGQTGDPQAWGCEFLYDQWWVTCAANLQGHGLVYHFGLDGNLIGSIPQPNTSQLGWFDLATDGHYLYGSDSHVIYGIDTTGQIRDTIPSPLNPSRAIAYDSLHDRFWLADYTTDIYEIDRAGNVILRILNPAANPLEITGLAWNAADANGYKLYVFSRNGANSQTRVTRVLPVAPFTMETAADLAGEPGDMAAGCAITSNWNCTLLVFGAVMRNETQGCRLGIYEMSFNSSWINLSPATGTVPGGQPQQMTLSFDPSILRNATYDVNARFTSVVCDTTLVLPIRLVVQQGLSVPTGKSTAMPTDFALHQNYPNPFNPITQIRFDLPRAEHVQLRIYNSLGQLVTTLADESRPAGEYALTWDAHNVATGLYLCRIQAGSFVQTKKMLLLK